MSYIREIFSSIQGEGPFVGYKQLFIRFCRCNLNCSYCDTDFDIKKAKDYTVQEIIDICNHHSDCHSVSLTGGEPLLEYDFIKEFAPKIQLPIYLETNGTLVNELEKVIDYVSYIAADIKIESCTGKKTDYEKIENFFAIAHKKSLFAKVVFDSSITEEEIDKITYISKKYDIELVLQPMMKDNKPSIPPEFMLETLNKCLIKHKKTRLVPQVHKFINVD